MEARKTVWEESILELVSAISVTGTNLFGSYFGQLTNLPLHSIPISRKIFSDIGRVISEK